jgi:hypothetical protein
MVEDTNQPERPGVEPEIIPPDRRYGDSNWHGRTARPYVFSGLTGETHRIYVGRLGPIGFALLMLIVGLLVAVVILAVVGAVLLWIPILALLVAAGAIIRLLRR